MRWQLVHSGATFGNLLLFAALLVAGKRFRWPLAVQAIVVFLMAAHNLQTFFAAHPEHVHHLHRFPQALHRLRADVASIDAWWPSYDKSCLILSGAMAVTLRFSHRRDAWREWAWLYVVILAVGAWEYVISDQMCKRHLANVIYWYRMYLSIGADIALATVLLWCRATAQGELP